MLTIIFGSHVEHEVFRVGHKLIPIPKPASRDVLLQKGGEYVAEFSHILQQNGDTDLHARFQFEHQLVCGC